MIISEAAMTFEDLKGCLILLSYDTVRLEDESQTWQHSYAGAQVVLS